MFIQFPFTAQDRNSTHSLVWRQLLALYGSWLMTRPLKRQAMISLHTLTMTSLRLPYGLGLFPLTKRIFLLWRRPLNLTFANTPLHQVTGHGCAAMPKRWPSVSAQLRRIQCECDQRRNDKVCYIMLHHATSGDCESKTLETIGQQFHHLPFLRPLHESRVNCSPSPTHSPMKSQGVSAVPRDPHLHMPPEVRQKPSSARSNWLEAVQSEASSQTSLKSQCAWNVGFPEVFPSESRSVWLIS